MTPTLSIADLANCQDTDQPDSNKVALQLDGKKVTYQALEARSDSVAAQLRVAGVEPGERVVLIGRNSFESLEVLIGAAKVGAVPAFINWRLTAVEMTPLIQDCEPSSVFTDDEFAGTVAAAVSDLPHTPEIVVLGGDAWCERYESTECAVPFAPVDSENDPSVNDDLITAVQLYTSGTTGLPKGALLTRAGLGDALADAIEFWEINPNSTVLSVLPLYHIAGLGLAIATLWAGARLIISSDAAAGHTLRYIEEESVTHLILASSMLQELIAAKAFGTTNLSSLQTVSYGAAPIGVAEMRRAIERMNCRIMQPYGLTETSGVLTLLDDNDHRQSAANPELAHRLSSCGKPRPGVELRIVDPTSGERLEVNQVGEIQVRSARVMSGYWKLPEASSEVILEGGWFRTGDIASVDSDGYVTLKDRLKDIIISGGENIYPQEVEFILRDHPSIMDVAVVGRQHEKWGETPVAAVTTSGDGELDSEAVIAFARDRLAHYKCPTAVVTVSALPRNATGKVLRKELRQMLNSR